jgi:hypothetical protein
MEGVEAMKVEEEGWVGKVSVIPVTPVNVDLSLRH